MYESWIEDLREENTFARNYAILTGSFSNMELAKKMINKDNNTFESSDADFEESTRWVQEGMTKQEVPQRRRRRRRQGVVDG